MNDASTCSFPDCGRKVEALGRCQTHNRQARRGEPLKPIRHYDLGLSPIERFMRRVEINTDTGCWNWVGAGPGEYPRFSHDGIRPYAYRWIWAYFNGPIPDGYDIDHINHCYCVNPDHLRCCTHAQNGQNLIVSRKNTSGYRGVSLHRASGLWHARVKHQGKTHSFGYYKTAEDAGVAAAEGRKMLFTHSHT